ncbi:nucleotidyltransferase family protein [Rhodoferax koreense]|uniref:nucleotidyltransferase family protein n=1 Tax=Rhodoferax koreensis TaxID=1842727 RepID=UPI001EF4C74D|nr:NTP transferase domain-containing protein [Rhodoferax koreense]
MPVVIVLAAGRGERFAASGGQVHKLEAPLAGKRVRDHTLAAVRASGLPWWMVKAAPGLRGMGDSIRAGVLATQHAPGWLMLPADLPLVRPASLLAVAQALTHAPVVVPHCDGQRGHPVGFDASCMHALLDLEGKEGAARIVQAQRERDMVVDLALNDIGVITDIDTVDDLCAAEQLLTRRLAAYG